MADWKDCGHCDSPGEHALHIKLHEVECRLFESERKLDNNARLLAQTDQELEDARNEVIAWREAAKAAEGRLQDALSRLDGIKALRVEMVDLIGADLDATLQGLLWPKDVEKPAQLTGKTTPIRKMELHAELFDPPPE